MQRRALIAANAAGSPEAVEGILARFGFTRTSQAEDREAALAQMREAHFDLVILPVDAISPAELVAADRFHGQIIDRLGIAVKWLFCT